MTESTAAADAPGIDLDEVWSGLRGEPRSLSAKLFYDERGSELFDEITRLPEYYLTAAERALLRESARRWLRDAGVRTLAELGPGSGEKARLLLADPETPVRCYVPVDISETYLNEIAARMSESLPRLSVRPARADIEARLALPPRLARPLAVAFLGSTIGNYEDPDAVALLRRIRSTLQPGDVLLLGADLAKDAGILEAAYDDAAGVTAAFNLNVLRRLNRELGTDFDLDGWEHMARYDDAASRVEMHLRARSPQRVRVPDRGAVEVPAGETIRTEISIKYDRPRLERLLAAAALRVREWEEGDGRFALLLAEPTSGGGYTVRP
jgi:L-histidine Nalpha-methyltransferase